MKNLKPSRLVIFIVAVLALAKFFEAGRLIASDPTLAHIGFSVISGFIFLYALLVMGYWIYEEEKEKNNLKTKFKLYEWVYSKKLELKSQKNKLMKEQIQ